MIARLTVALLLAAWAGSALAGPAPWHLWSSKVDGKLVCAQTSPGWGWQHHLGPYKDSRCEKLAIAK